MNNDPDIERRTNGKIAKITADSYQRVASVGGWGGGSWRNLVLPVIALAVVPVVDVADGGRFALQVAGVFLAGEALGVALYVLGRRSARAA